MNNSQDTSGCKLDEGTKLAYQRTFLAWERTQMAWVRTALSLISFGFTISKFFEYISQKTTGAKPFFTARSVGLTMIAMGFISLIVSEFIHRKSLRTLRNSCPDLPKSLAGFYAYILGILSVLAFVSAFKNL